MARFAAFLVGSCLMVSSSAFAQQQFDHGYVTGAAGSTFGTSKTSWLAGVGIGITILPNLLVYVSGSNINDVTPNTVQDAFNQPAAIVFFRTGALPILDAQTHALIGTIGLKGYVPTMSIVKPYVLGGFGGAHLDGHVTEARLGDITTVIAAAANVPLSTHQSDEFASEIGVGVDISKDRLHLDVGYRYNRISDINVSRAYVAGGLRF